MRRKTRAPARRRYDLAVVYWFVVDWKMANGGNAPTLRTIARACDMRNVSSACYALDRLERLGLIQIRGANQLQLVGEGWAFKTPSNAPPRPAQRGTIL